MRKGGWAILVTCLEADLARGLGLFEPEDSLAQRLLAIHARYLLGNGAWEATAGGKRTRQPSGFLGSPCYSARIQTRVAAQYSSTRCEERRLFVQMAPANSCCPLGAALRPSRRLARGSTLTSV